jgi:septum formation topological specificity factor MinE
MKKPDKFNSYIKDIFHVISAYKIIRQYKIMFKLNYDDITILTLKTLLSLKQDKLYNDDKNNFLSS